MLIPIFLGSSSGAAPLLTFCGSTSLSGNESTFESAAVGREFVVLGDLPLVIVNL
jgi:hypothetical protein